MKYNPSVIEKKWQRKWHDLGIFKAKIDHKKTPHPRGKKFVDPGGYGILLMKNKSRVLFDMSEDYGTPTIIKIL